MYSNITPPSRPAYDTAAYPYEILVFTYETGAEDWYSVGIEYSAMPFTYDPAKGITHTGTYISEQYTESGWYNWGEQTDPPELMPGVVNATLYRRIWTNHDILDGSGDVYLAANTATPVETEEDRLTRIKSQLAGIIAAWCAPVRQFPQREPVAWETLWDGKPEQDGGISGDNGDYFWLWYSSEGNKNRLSAGDSVRVTVDGNTSILTVQIMDNGPAFVEAGNRWLYQGTYTDDGTDVYFWEYGGALRFFTRKIYAEMPRVKLERAIR